MRWILVASLALAIGAAALLYATRARTPSPSPPSDGARDGFRRREESTTAVVRRADRAGDADAPADAHRTQDELVDDVRESGPTTAAWTSDALAVVRELRGAELTDIACYVAGCTARVAFGSEAEATNELDAWRHTTAFSRWASGAMVTPIELRDDGVAELAIVVYPPPR